MSFYSIVCVEIVTAVWNRVLSKLKDRRSDIHRPEQVWLSKDMTTMLLVFEWNHAPTAYEISDYLYNELGLDFHDFNITCVDESNAKSTDGLLDVHYTCTNENGGWRVSDNDYGKSTVSFDGDIIIPSYRLTDEEYAQYISKKDKMYDE